MSKSFYYTLVAVLVAVLALFATMQATPARAVGGALTQALGGQLPQVAKMVAEKLGVEIPESAAGLLSQVGKSVAGSVTDPSKLAEYGLKGLNKGDKVSLANQGKDLLQVKDEASGKTTDVKMSDLFGAAAKFLK